MDRSKSGVDRPEASIPRGSWILVTGANGYVGSHVVLQFLEHGYKVRGTIRAPSKASWMASALFQSYLQSGDLDLVTVPDMTVPGAFDEAIKGVSAVIHVATTSGSPDPNAIIMPNNAAILSLLGAAASESTVKSFVLTASFFAHTNIRPNIAKLITKETYYDEMVDLAWSAPDPPYDPNRAMPVYFASKVEQEKLLWRFVAEKKPPFAVNAVSPGLIAGRPLCEAHLTKPAPPQFMKALWHGQIQFAELIPAFFFVHVTDVAIMHVAAALDANIQNKRIQVWSKSCVWNDVLRAMRSAYPDQELVDNIPEQGQLLYTAEDDIALDLLKKWAGRDWLKLDQAVRETMDAWKENEG